MQNYILDKDHENISTQCALNINDSQKGCISISGLPEFRSFGQNRKFSTFGFRFRPPKVKVEYGQNSRKALDFFFPSVFQDGLVFLIHFWQLIFASTLTFEIVHY